MQKREQLELALEKCNDYCDKKGSVQANRNDILRYNDNVRPTLKYFDEYAFWQVPKIGHKRA